jgi:hypothetical protein
LTYDYGNEPQHDKGKHVKQTFPRNERVRSEIQCHFDVSAEMWRLFQHKLAKHGYSASHFFRQRIKEFLEDELDSPLARYHRICCNNCPYADTCKADITIEIRCLLASLALCARSLFILIKKVGA